MEQATGIEKIAAALAKAQAAFSSAKKDSINPHFKSKYADLAATAEACMTALNANEIAVSQDVATVAPGVSVVTKLLHSSGQTLVSSPLVLPVVQQTPQAYGSTISYGRRYSLAAFVGVVSEDDDGNAGSGKAEPKATTPQTEGGMTAKLRESIAVQEKCEQLRSEFAACGTLDKLGEVWAGRADLRKEVGKENATRIFKRRQGEIEEMTKKVAKATAAVLDGTEPKPTEDVPF